jgi:uncharacterized membrane protein
MAHRSGEVRVWALLAVIAIWTCCPVAQTQPAAKKSPKKILYFEGQPRPEMKFIKRATDDAANLSLVVLQRTADGKYLRLNVDGPLDLANGFPWTREELFKYQGIMLGSAEASVFTAEQQRMLADFVTVRGGALLALGGEQSFGEGGWLETPLSYLLPIAFDPNRNPKSPRLSLKVSVWPTPEAIDHPALQIADDKNTALKMWRELPPVTIVNAVYPRSSAEILLTGNDHNRREQVVLAVQRHGAGRVVVFTPQDSWQWVMKTKLNNPAHERFWRALLSWLVEGV